MFIDPNMQPGTPGINPNQPLDFTGQGAKVAQQRKLAQYLRQKADAKAPQGEMVSGHYVNPSILQRLLPILQGYQAKQAEGAADEQDQNLSIQTEADANTWRGQLPQAIPATPREEDMMGNTMQQEAPAQPITRESILKHTLAGMRNPRTREEAGLVNQSLTSELSRSEDKEFKNEQARAGAQEKLEMKREQLAAEKAQLDMKLADRNLDRESRDAMQKRLLEMQAEWKSAERYARAQIAGIAAEARKAAAGGDKPLKNLPAAQSKSWIENSTALRNIDRAFKEVADNPKAFGASKVLPEWANSRMDPKGVAARAVVADIGSLKVHDRSGAAVTAAETPRLMPFIPRIHDDPATIVKKLENFKAHYEAIQQEILDYADMQGYKPPGAMSSKVAPNAPAAAAPIEKVIGGKTYVNKNGQWYEK